VSPARSIHYCCAHFIRGTWRLLSVHIWPLTFRMTSAAISTETVFHSTSGPHAHARTYTKQVSRLLALRCVPVQTFVMIWVDVASRLDTNSEGVEFYLNGKLVAIFISYSPLFLVPVFRSVEQSHPLGTNNHWDGQEITGVLWNPKVRFRVHKNQSLVPVLSRLHPVHPVIFCFIQDRFFNIILSVYTHVSQLVS